MILQMEQSKPDLSDEPLPNRVSTILHPITQSLCKRTGNTNGSHFYIWVLSSGSESHYIETNNSSSRKSNVLRHPPGTHVVHRQAGRQAKHPHTENKIIVILNLKKKISSSSGTSISDKACATYLNSIPPIPHCCFTCGWFTQKVNLQKQGKNAFNYNCAT